MGEKEGFLPYPDNFETICIHHSDQLRKQTTKSPSELITPVMLSNLIKDRDWGPKPEYIKNRLKNPTRSVLESLLATLNHCKYCLTFSSGMGAITAVLGLLKCGQHIIASDDLYGGTSSCLSDLASRFGISASFVDFYDYEKLQEAITPRTRMLWIENPTNPKLKVIDLVKCSQIATENNLLLSVDNSFLTPYLQCPTDWGADISMQAVTKFLNGHSDIIMGTVSTNNSEVFQKLNFIQQHYGHVPSPFDCFQVIRGLKTLPIRMRRHHFNSLEVAKFLMQHPKIECVHHPAHRSHPKHEVFKLQTSGHSGMVSFYVRGNEEETKKFMSKLSLVSTAVSMGGPESCIETPFHLSHKNAPTDLKNILQYTPSLVRMSVGLEDVKDLIEDLDQALNQIC